MAKKVVDLSAVDKALGSFRDLIDNLPKTDDGGTDWEKCRSDEHLKDAIERTNLEIVIPTNDEVWQSYEPHTKLLHEAAASKTKFAGGEKPLCVIDKADNNSGEDDNNDEKIRGDIRFLLFLASQEGRSLHQAMEQAVRDTNGSYYPGPTKEFKRILYKAVCEYEGDARRVLDVERAIGLYDSADDLGEAIRHLAEIPGLSIVRVKDNFSKVVYKSHYRDMKFNVMSNRLVGELQLTLRSIHDLNKKTHCVYEIDRVANNENYKPVQPDGGGLVSIPMLRLEELSLSETSCLEDLQEKLDKALPPDCVYAGAYRFEGGIMVCLGVKNIAALAKLRDEILLESEFKKSIAPLQIDIGAFVDLYATNMMKFTDLTSHQEEQLKVIKDADVALLLAPAGGGKTFVAVQRMLITIQQGKTVLIVARNLPLVLFVVRWIVIASRKKAEVIVEKIRILIDGKYGSFAEGPKCVEVVVDENKRKLLKVGEADETSTYGIAVVDEAHHIANNKILIQHLRKYQCECHLFLGDLSQSNAENSFNEESVRGILNLPTTQQVLVGKLTQVVRSTKRIVNGAASFQLAAASKAETKTHSSSVGPALEAFLFPLVSDDQRFVTYAKHVIQSLKSVQRSLDGANLDDRVMIICPSDDFVEDLRGPLMEELRAQISDQEYNLVSALEASAALPMDTFDGAKDRPQWLVLDSIERVDGLERLIVLAVGLDNKISRSEDDFQTRSSLYRALTRAQLAVAVVNEYVRDGWLEFLGAIQFDDGAYDESLERRREAENPADNILNSASRSTNNGVQNDSQTKDELKDETKIESNDESKDELNDDIKDETIGQTKSPRKEMIVRQKIWDTRGIEIERDTPRFMPFQSVLMIPVDRCYDVQWNPPGHPSLRCSYLQNVYGDRSSRKDPGDYYTLIESAGKTSFVRQRSSDESIVPVFQTVEFVVLGKDVLLFKGDGSYGTLVKGKNIPAGNSGGSWSTTPTNYGTAMQWIRDNFSQ